MTDPSRPTAADAAMLAKVEQAQSSPWNEQIGMCIGCVNGPGRCRIGIVREWQDGSALRGIAVLNQQHEGGPDVAHGGVVAALLDEIMGHVPWSRGHFSVTKTLSVAFKRPVPLHRQLGLEAHVHSVEDGRWSIRGEISLLETGVVLAEGEGLWVERSIAHYQRARTWLAADGPTSGEALLPERRSD